MSDPVWGLIELYPHEAALMVTPLMRRLHNIRQTAFAFYAHPGASHDRYLHSLGVMHQATEMWYHLRRYHPEQLEEHGPHFFLLRLAALLHDVGHGPFSHSSEGFFKFLPDLTDLRAELAEELSVPLYKVGAAEAISATIVLSPAFREFFAACAEHSEEPLGEVSCEEIARFFFGLTAGPDRPWLPKLISGSIDADKLDYLHRDGDFAGLETAVDMTRLYSNLRLSENRLIVLRDGLSSVSDLAENRFNLTALMYSEPQSQVAESMFQRAIKLDGKRADTRLKSTASYFEFDDASISAYLRSSGDPLVRDLAWRIQYGPLFSVALTLSPPLLTRQAKRFGLERDAADCAALMDRLRDRHLQTELEAKIAHRAKELLVERSISPIAQGFDGAAISFDERMVSIVITKPLSFQELGEEPILVHGQEFAEEFAVPVNELLALEERRLAYRQRLWRGFIVTHPDFMPSVRDATLEVLHELMA